MAFLSEFKENEFAHGNYYRIRSNNIIELGEHNEEKLKNQDTRVLIDTNAIKIKDENKDYILYKCKISWYSTGGSTVIINGTGGNLEYKVRNCDVLIDIDINELFSDKQYFKYFMETLLDEDRIISILQDDKKINPEIKRGGYIGSVSKIGETYRINTDKKIGEMCYYLEENVQERKRRNDCIMEYYDEKIEKLNEERKKLTNKHEIQELGKRKQKM